MVLLMRTSIILEDELAERFRETAKRRGQSLSAFLAEAGKAALSEKPAEGEAFHLLTCGGRGVQPGMDLDKTGELLAAEDETHYGRAK